MYQPGKKSETWYISKFGTFKMGIKNVSQIVLIIAVQFQLHLAPQHVFTKGFISFMYKGCFKGTFKVQNHTSFYMYVILIWGIIYLKHCVAVECVNACSRAEKLVFDRSVMMLVIIASADRKNIKVFWILPVHRPNWSGMYTATSLLWPTTWVHQFGVAGAWRVAL